MSIVSVDNISPIGSGTSVTVNSAATLVLNNANSTGVITATSFVGSGIHIDDSITHIGDTNTKIRFPANDTISFETAGSERLRIYSDGDAKFSSKLGVGVEPVETFDVRTTGSAIALIGSTNASGAYLKLDGDSNGDGSGGDYARLVHDTDGRLYIDNLKSTADIVFRNTSSATERLRITSDGITIFGSSGAPNNSNTVSIHPSDGMISFGMDGRSSYVTGTNSCYIYSGEGASGTTLAGELYLQSRSNVDRDIVFVTGSTPAERLRVHSSGALGIAGKNYGTSGQVLMSQGTGSAIQWASPAYIIHDVWALSSSMTTTSTETKVTAWSRANAYSATIGSAMTESSGIFTFPETGKYKVVFDVYYQTANSSRFISHRIYKVISATSTRIAQKLTSVNTAGSQWYQSDRVEAYFDVTNVSTHKIEFTVASENATTLASGHSSSLIQTAAYFTKIGDT